MSLNAEQSCLNLYGVSFVLQFFPLVSPSLFQSQKPVPYVKEMNDAAIFYTNRVLKDYKDS